MTEMPDIGSPLQSEETLSEKVYARLQDALVKNALLPGSPISEPKFSSQLSVSRTVLREALVRLEAEGYITRSSSGRWHVATMDSNDIRDIYQCRGALEALGASLAASRHGQDLHGESAAEMSNELDEMSTELGAMRDAYDAGDIIESAMHSTRFHDLVIEASGNRKLEVLMNMLRQQLLQNRVRILHHNTRGRSFLNQNEALYRAIAAGDSESAAASAQASAEEDLASVLALTDRSAD